MSLKRQVFSDAEYGSAYNQFLADAIEGVVGHHPLLRQVKTRRTRHSGHLRTYFDQPWDQHPVRSQTAFSFSRKEVRQADLFSHRLVVRCIAEQIQIERVKHRSSHLAEGLKRAGRLLAGNPKLTWEAVLQALDKVRITFDDDGNPHGFDIWCGVEARRSLDASPVPADYEERAKAIIDKNGRNGLLQSVLADFLDKLPKERDYDAPFLALLNAMGFVDVHLTHGPFEKGKDFIAKSPDGAAQWVFQTKKGQLGVQDLNRGIMGQVQAAALSGYGHPSFDVSLPRQVVLVTTGGITQPASDQLKSFSDDVLTKLNHPQVLFWGRDKLVELFLKHGLEGVRSTQLSGADLSAQGRFYLLYGSVVRNELRLTEVDDHSAVWVTDVLPTPQAVVVGATEGALLAGRCRSQGYLYEAFFCDLATLRMSLALLFVVLDTPQQSYFETLAHAQMATVFDSAQVFTEAALAEWESAGRMLDGAISSPAIFISYPVHCARIVESLGLLCFHPDAATSAKASDSLTQFCAAEPGVAHPISDRYAVSIVVACLGLLRHGKAAEACALIERVTVWLCDRLEQGAGIAHVDASPQEEVNQLLGFGFPSFAISKQNLSFLATALTDLAAWIGDAQLYADVVNDLLAVHAIPENYQVPDTLGQFLIDHVDVKHTTGIELTPELPQDYQWPQHSPCCAHEAPSYRVADLLGPVPHLALILLLRDRLFLSLWPAWLGT